MRGPNGQANILIVDDDEVDVRGIKRALDKRRIANPVHVAHDGIEALELLRGAGGREKLPRPFVILLDLNMPRMNGVRFLQELRADAALSSSIVFVLTTSTSNEDKLAAYREHVAGYILKSNVGRDFMQVIDMLDLFLVSVEFPPETMSLC